MSNTVLNQTTKDTSGCVPKESGCVPDRLLGTLVPYRDDDSETTCNCSFRNTEEEASRKQATSVETDSSQYKRCAPYKATVPSRHLQTTRGCCGEAYTEVEMVFTTLQLTINAPAGYDATRYPK